MFNLRCPPRDNLYVGRKRAVLLSSPRCTSGATRSFAFADERPLGESGLSQVAGLNAVAPHSRSRTQPQPSFKKARGCGVPTMCVGQVDNKPESVVVETHLGLTNETALDQPVFHEGRLAIPAWRHWAADALGQSRWRS